VGQLPDARYRFSFENFPFSRQLQSVHRMLIKVFRQKKKFLHPTQVSLGEMQNIWREEKIVGKIREQIL